MRLRLGYALIVTLVVAVQPHQARGQGAGTLMKC